MRPLLVALALQLVAVAMCSFDECGRATTAPLSRQSRQTPGRVDPTGQDTGSQCQNFTYAYCNRMGTSGTPYSKAWFPNGRGQTLVNCALGEIADFVNYPSVRNCSELLGTLLCFYYFPWCDGDFKVLPCRSVCEQVRDECRPIFASLTLPWPEHLDCTDTRKFPIYLDDNRSLIQCAKGPPSTPVTPPIITTKEPLALGDHCGDLEPPVNGEVSADNTTVGSTATYSCNEGYRLRGESTRNCQGDAVWSGEPPVCESNDCGDLSDPNHGSVNYGGTTVGFSASYACDEGYELSGVNVRSCRGTGVWSGQAPSCIDPCEAVVCPTCARLRATAGRRTFQRNAYSFAAHVVVTNVTVNDVGNRSYIAEVVTQYLPTDSPQVGNRVITIETTTHLDCCGECAELEKLMIQADNHYVFGGFYDDVLGSYLDVEERCLVAPWDPSKHVHFECDVWPGHEGRCRRT